MNTKPVKTDRADNSLKPAVATKVASAGKPWTLGSLPKPAAMPSDRMKARSILVRSAFNTGTY